jgi:hypothetical protein
MRGTFLVAGGDAGRVLGLLRQLELGGRNSYGILPLILYALEIE